MKLTQVKLRHENKEMVCWINLKKGIKEGVKVKIIGDEKWYTIVKLYNQVLDEKEIRLKQYMNKDFGKSLRRKV